MTDKGTGLQNAIIASWERCERQHKLLRDAARPILRLQSSEITPRHEEMVALTGGRQGLFRQIADLAIGAGHCLVLTDADGVLVRLESRHRDQPDLEQNGIALGSCWDERIAGTNGVSMAMSEHRAVTVRGQDHYFAKLAPFSCTAVPLLDAANQTIGTINLTALDRGSPTDYLFAQQLLNTAADRIQRLLFEKHYSEAMIVAVSLAGRRDLLRGNELIAVDEAGMIVGSTADAHRLAGVKSATELTGKAFSAVFGADAGALQGIPERVMSARIDNGPLFNLSALMPGQMTPRGPDRAKAATGYRKPLRRRLAPSFQELAVGSAAMADICARAQAHFQRAVPMVLEGESGSGKSALIGALNDVAQLPPEQIITIDCALLGEDETDRINLRTVFDQARVSTSLTCAAADILTLVFDNIDELPAHGQAGLRNLLDEFELGDGLPPAVSDAPGLRIIATTRRPLMEAVQRGQFRDDLYFLITGALIDVPPLRAREDITAIAAAMAAQLTGETIEITPEAAEALAGYAWPGNLRELRHALQQALTEGDGRRISLVDFRATPVFGRAPTAPSPGARPVRATPTMLGYDERTMLLDALVSARWNVSQAARTLGIGRATIHRKMAHHGITRPE